MKAENINSCIPGTETCFDPVAEYAKAMRSNTLDLCPDMTTPVMRERGSLI